MNSGELNSREPELEQAAEDLALPLKKIDQTDTWTDLLELAKPNSTNSACRAYIVEGPPASGKTVLTKRLVVEAHMHGMPALLVPLVRPASGVCMHSACMKLTKSA